MFHRNTFFSTIFCTYIFLTAFFVRNRAVECINWLCANPDLNISDYRLLNSTISVNVGPALFNRIVVRAVGTHTWQSDLIMYLTSPSGDTVLLAEDVGDYHNHFNISFDDRASSRPTNLDVGGDSYLPNSSFAIFNNTDVNGDWIFHLYDYAWGDNGWWTQWCIIELCYRNTFSPTMATPDPTMEPSSMTSSPTEETLMPTVTPSRATAAPVPTPEPTSDGCFHWVCANPNANITDYQTISSIIELNADWDPALYGEMTVRVVGSHTWHGDLEFLLEAPDGTIIVLADDVGYWGWGATDFNITFDDNAAEQVYSLNVNGSSFRPNETFANFNGVNINGEWRFHLHDRYGGDSGIFEQWCIVLMCYDFTQSPTEVSESPTPEPTPEIPSGGCIYDICTEPNLEITSYNNISAMSAINVNVADETELISIVVSVRGTHTWQSDLHMVLIGPNYEEVVLVSHVGSDNDDFNIAFDDNAPQQPTNLDVAGYAFQPEGNLSIFEGIDVSGDWIVEIYDTYAGDEGVFEEWCIVELCYGPTMAPTSSGSGKNSDDELSTGGIVGIAVACSVLVIILIGILCFKFGVCYNKEVEKNKDNIQMEVPKHQGHQLLEDDQFGTDTTTNFAEVLNPEGPTAEVTTGSTDVGN